jgi:hypothetical protein
VLDHVFTDAIGALRDALESALLERQAFEERFSADVLLGDLTWATSYSLPGEGLPPRVQADLTLSWPTWAQTAWRTWYVGEMYDAPPRIEIEVVVRVQRLVDSPDLPGLLARLPARSPALGVHHLERSAPTVEAFYPLPKGGGTHTSGSAGGGGRDTNAGNHPMDIGTPEFSVEVSYEGVYEFDEATLADGSLLDRHFGAMGGWISSTLVAVGDLPWDFLPPVDDLPFDHDN